MKITELVESLKTPTTAGQIEITDNMKIWALALVAASENPELEGFSDTVKAMMAYKDACRAVALETEELDAITELIKQNRLGELAI